MSDARRELVDRVRTALPQDREVREVAMFGGIAIMLDGAMVVSAGKDGDLLVRIDPDDHDRLVARPGAQPAVMKRGREMGPGWISVSADAIATDEQLATWLQVALDHHAAQGRR